MPFGSGIVASRAGIEVSIPSMVVSSASIVVRNPGIKPRGKSKHIALGICKE